MADTFTKFDQLGSVLTELDFASASLHVTHHESGRIHWAVYLHPVYSRAFQGIGKTPTEALVDALEKAALSPLDAIEAKAAEIAA